MLRRFLRSRQAGVGIAIALAAPIVVGGLGLGAETGYHHVLDRRLQDAADVAAFSATTQLRSAAGEAGMVAAARQAADASGGAGAALSVFSPPVSGARAGDARSVEARLERTQPRLFSRIFVEAPVRLGGRAVATILEIGQACVLALSPTAAGAVTAGGSALVQLNGCDIASNSNAPNAFDMLGGAVRVEAGCLDVVGGADVTGGLTLDCGAPRELSPPVPDPFGDLPEPAREGPCASVPKGGGAVTLTASHAHSSGATSMRICETLSPQGPLTLAPGLYIVEGDFVVNGNIPITGSGVTLFVTGEIRMNGTASLALSAPSSGPYAGLLAMGPRVGGGTSQIVNGNLGSTLDGAIYFPGAEVTMSGNASSGGGCMQIVAGTVEFTGSSTFDIRCDAPKGRRMVSNRPIRLVE